MENQFFVDSEHLSPAALEKKHRLETDPSSRKNHMEYMPGMEIIESDVCRQVMSQMESYDYSIYTARDVRAALDHVTCSVEDFKALLSPAAEPFLEEMAQKARMETSKHFGNTVYLFTPLYIANYCENYCVYCGFNCYNHINRMKLNIEQIEPEMKVIADSGMEEILILTGESRAQSDVKYIVSKSAQTVYSAFQAYTPISLGIASQTVGYSALIPDKSIPPQLPPQAVQWLKNSSAVIGVVIVLSMASNTFWALSVHTAIKYCLSGSVLSCVIV